MAEMLIKESTLQELGDLVRASKSTGDKVPVTELKGELASLIGTASIGKPRPTHSINFARYSENPTDDFALSRTLKNNIIWSDKTDSGYITFAAHGSDPYVVIGGASAGAPLCNVPTDQLAYVVIKYRVNSPITDAKAYGEFYTSRTDGVQWGNAYGNHVSWEWTCDGEWHLAFVDARYVWGNVKDVYLHSFRFDVLAAGTNPDDADFSGFTIDIEYINFFVEKYYAEVFVQTEKYVSSAVDGAIVDSSYVYNKNERYYTGTENVYVTKYPHYSFQSFPSAPQTSCDKIIAVVGGQEVVLTNSVANQWLATNGGIYDDSGKYEKLIFEGWVNPTGQPNAWGNIAIDAFLSNVDASVASYSSEPIKDDELCSIIGSTFARRFRIAVDLTSLADGIHEIRLYAAYHEGTMTSKPYHMSSWGIIRYYRKADYVDDDGNAYRVASNKVYKNGVAIDAIKATPWNTQDDSYPYIAYNPQIEVFQKIKGYNGEFVYPDSIVVKTDEPVAKTGAENDPVIVPLNITSNGTWAAPDNIHGYNPIMVDVPEKKPVLVPLTATTNGVYPVQAGTDGYSDVTVDVPSSGSNEKMIQILNRTVTEITAEDLKGVDTIGDHAFAYCENLRSVVIPTGVYSIANDAFNNDNSLESVAISNSVFLIMDLAFHYCSNLATITVDENNTTYLGSGNCIIERLSKRLLIGCKGSVIPSDGSVTSIGDRAFYGCDRLTSVTIPDCVTSIGNYAFCNCSGLTNIEIPDSVTSIGSHSFINCESLRSITLNCISLLEIQQWTFSGVPSDCPIYVPAALVDAYKTAQYWSERADCIFPIPVQYETEENEYGVTYNISATDYTVEENSSGGNTIIIE